MKEGNIPGEASTSVLLGPFYGVLHPSSIPSIGQSRIQGGHEEPRYAQALTFVQDEVIPITDLEPLKNIMKLNRVLEVELCQVPMRTKVLKSLQKFRAFWGRYFDKMAKF
jgi:hypothetical protein